MASASYISLVEADKRTPGPEVVDQLARKLGCSTDYLLTGADAPSTASARIDLTFATLALAEGHHQAALERLTAIEQEGLPADLVERITEQTAKALLGVGNLEGAIELLEPLLRQARSQSRSLQALLLANTLTGSYLEAGDLVRAVELAEDALQHGREAHLEQSTEYVRLLATLSWALYERGDVHYARQRIREILPAVEATGDAKARGSLYWNAALFAQEMGHEAEAIDLTQRAMALIAEHSDQADLARLRVHLGWLLLRGSEPDPAAALDELRTAAPAVQQYAGSIDLSYCLVEQARALLALGRLDEARAHAEQGLALLRSPGDVDDVGEAPRYQSVQARLTLAEVQDALGDAQAATSNYRQAAETLTMMTTGRKAAEIWGGLAVRLQERGDISDAMQAYQQAMQAAGIQAALGARQPVHDSRSEPR